MRSTRQGRRLRRRLGGAGGGAHNLLNLTSMIDILTVLLFFLLVYAADLAIFTPMSALKLNLPSPSTAPLPPQKEPLQLDIVIRSADMELFRNGSTFSRIARRSDGADYTALTAQLSKLKAQSPITEVITLRPQPDVAYEVLVKVMDTARETVTATATQPLFPNVLIGDAPVGVGP